MGLCETCGTICPFYIENVECDNYKPKTNEEWFCQFPTEEKAKNLSHFAKTLLKQKTTEPNVGKTTKMLIIGKCG